MTGILPTYQRFVNGVPVPSISRRSFRLREKYLIVSVLLTFAVVWLGALFYLPEFKTSSSVNDSVYNVYKRIQKAGPELLMPPPLARDVAVAGAVRHGEEGDDPHVIEDRNRLRAKIEQEMGMKVLERPQFDDVPLASSSKGPSRPPVDALEEPVADNNAASKSASPKYKMDELASKESKYVPVAVGPNVDPDIKHKLETVKELPDTDVTYPGGRHLIREALSRRYLPSSALDIMLASLSANSLKQYDSCLKKWWNYCKDNSVDVFNGSVPVVISFLTKLFNEGLQYGSLNSIKAALSLLLGSSLAKDDNVLRFMKGVYKLRPTLPKYNMTWDTNCVLDQLTSWVPNESLTLEKLSKKTIVLLALTTAHRVQTLSKINVKNIEIFDDRILIKIPDLIKTSRPTYKQPVLCLPFFTERPNVCPARTLLTYIERTVPLRTSDYLFVAIKKPHKPVGTQTLSRWIKGTLTASGIDTSTFTAHSTRHAATSRARRLGVSVDVIRNTAGWSGNSCTFAKFYNRAVVDNQDTALAHSIID